VKEAPASPAANRKERVVGRRGERLLTCPEVAERLGPSERFPRRLVAERRIRFVRVGRHVRIPESAVDELIETGTVEPIVRRRGRSVA
jgi:excisionase family DNA binding protein